MTFVSMQISENEYPSPGVVSSPALQAAESLPLSYFRSDRDLESLASTDCPVQQRSYDDRTKDWPCIVHV